METPVRKRGCGTERCVSYRVCRSLFLYGKTKPDRTEREKAVGAEEYERAGQHTKHKRNWGKNRKAVKVKTDNGNAKKMYVCTSCLRSGKVERA